MMRTLLFSCLFVVACTAKGPEVPKGILPPEKMEAVLWDMLRADALMANPAHTDSLTPSYKKRVTLYQQVMRLHGTTQEGFEQSMHFYENRPDLLKTVFDSLQKRADVVPVSKPRARSLDSLRRVH